MSEIKPCPFCGSTNIYAREGESFKWRVVFCADCGAQAGDVRVNTLASDRASAIEKANVDALVVWNRRAGDE